MTRTANFWKVKIHWRINQSNGFCRTTDSNEYPVPIKWTLWLNFLLSGVCRRTGKIKPPSNAFTININIFCPKLDKPKCLACIFHFLRLTGKLHITPSTEFYFADELLNTSWCWFGRCCWRWQLWRAANQSGRHWARLHHQRQNIQLPLPFKGTRVLKRAIEL